MANIQIYQKKRRWNVGVVLFGIIFIYLVVTVLIYVTGRRVSVYEVREGSILKDTAYKGIVLREEEVVASEAEGYINYFAIEGSKVGKKQTYIRFHPINWILTVWKWERREHLPKPGTRS